MLLQGLRPKDTQATVGSWQTVPVGKKLEALDRSDLRSAEQWLPPPDF